MKYDDSEYCFLNFETELDNDAGATHMGMYLAWAILRGLGGDHFSMPEAHSHIEQLKARQTTGREVLLDRCDGKLTDDDFNPLGNAFTKVYYERLFNKDYERVFQADFPSTGHPTDDFCSIPDTWANFDRLAALLDQRFRQWQEARAKGPTPTPKPGSPGASAPVTATPAAATLDAAQPASKPELTLEPMAEPGQPSGPPSPQELRARAESGDAEAWYLIAVDYITGERVAQDFVQAAAALKKAADLGSVDAMFNLGVCYQNGDGLPKDGAKALHWFSQAAHGGHGSGLFMLAMAYRGTEHMHQDLGASNALMLMARMRGVTEAANQGIIAGSGGYVDLMKALMEPGRLLPVLAERAKTRQPVVANPVTARPVSESSATATASAPRRGTPITAQEHEDHELPGTLATLTGASGLFIMLSLATTLSGMPIRILAVVLAVIGALGVYRISKWLEHGVILRLFLTLVALIPVASSFICILVLFWRFRR